MTIRTDMLRAKAREVAPLLEKASEIAKKAAAEGRAMTAAEREVYNTAMAKAEPVLAGFKDARRDDSIMAVARGLADEIGGPVGVLAAAGRKDAGQRLSFKGMAAGVAATMLGEHQGQKALAPSGAAVVAQSFVGDPVALGRAATGLLDVLPTRVQATATYAFLRQTTRTNNADVVADGTTKPTSVIGLERVEQQLAVVAHLSEGVPRYWVIDNDTLMTFIDNELNFGLRAAVEAKVLADIGDTSGIQSQAWSTSIAQTLRKSLTKLETAGYTPGAIVLHPSDFETVELAVSTTNAIERQGLPYDAARRVLYGVPIAVTVSATVGVGHVLAAGAVELDTDSLGVGVQWSETSNSDDFAKNLIRARCEGRFGTSVLSPLGVVVADLTA